MYGLYKGKKYFVQVRSARNKNPLIVQNDNNEMLNRIAKHLNSRTPVVQIEKNIVDNVEDSVDDNVADKVDEKIGVPIFDETKNLGAFSDNFETLSDISIEEFKIQPDILNENISCESNNDNRMDVKLDEDTTESSEKYGAHCCKDRSTRDNCCSVDLESSEDESDVLTQSRKSNKKAETSLNVTRQKICDDIHLHIGRSQPKGRGKKTCCCYCKRLLTKLSKHYEVKHGNEEDVKKFLSLPKGSQERMQILLLLRRRGNYLFNLDPTTNKGELLVCRRPTEPGSKTACDFICCARCKGFFTKSSIRHHFRKCTQQIIFKSVNKKVQDQVHKCASSTFRNVIFPVMKQDEILCLVKYDELVITLGNKLCLRYKHTQHSTIRSRIRMLGRFLKVLKKRNSNVTDFYSILHPSVYNDCITTVNQLAGFDANLNVYSSPTVLSNLRALLKEIGIIAIAKCKKRNKLEEVPNIEKFLELLVDFSKSVCRSVKQSKLQAKSNKPQELLSFDDIKILYNFLQSKRRLAFQQVKDRFTYDSWRQLAEYTLISIQVFNRRKAGAIERMTIDDYMHQGRMTKKTDPKMYELLPEEVRKKPSYKYIRVLIRTESGKPAPTCLDCEMTNCIELLLRHRKEVNIHEKNPYIFALPGDDETRLTACEIIINILPTMKEACLSEDDVQNFINAFQ